MFQTAIPPRVTPVDALVDVLGIVDHSRHADLDFIARALALIDGDRRRSVDTALLPVSLPQLPGVDLYFKDEAAHPTGSLKHRLARALFTAGIVGGTIRAGRAVVEASSGSTAISEAYFARMLGLPFHAVMPKTTSPTKIAAVRALGGVCHLVDADQVYAEAAAVAAALGGVYLDQFTFAERVSDWRCDNLAAALLAQMEGERHAVPDWIVVGAGTGGTAATIGRHLRYRRLPTRLCVADVEHSAFYDGYVARSRDARCPRPSRIEGVGRPRIEPSFLPDIIDRMMKIPDAVSIAGMRIASEHLGRRVGASTGLNFVAAALLGREMAADGRTGSIATLICDGGDRYLASCYCDHWLADHGLAAPVADAERLLRATLL
ncbi:MAG TPA: pyridoxal-phosphate dependent enzyme [Sphingomonas sp.]|jgi:cysteine synthase A|uniref:PLP-dependent cysteine synthase family protein n=1 Tax=Sphingomonas sp. TaxID=28214 RepID=UPI002ED95707